MGANRNRKTESANTRQEATLYRFRLQIRSAAVSVFGKYRHTIELVDARQQAALLTLEYLDSGVIDGIARDAGDNPSQVDRYFLRELKCDLLNWAKGIHRRKQRESITTPAGFGLIEIRTRLVIENNPYDEVDLRMTWPLLCMQTFDGMSIKEIAKEIDVSPRTVDRMLAEEKTCAREHYST